MGKDGRDFSILLIQLSGRSERRLLSFWRVCSIVYLKELVMIMMMMMMMVGI